MTHQLTTSRRAGFAAALVLLLAPFATLPATGAPKAAAVPPAPAVAHSSGTAAMRGVSLPDYHEPPAYSVNLVIDSPQGDMQLRRFIDGGRIRTEITGDKADLNMVMIEMGDAKGTSLMLMPGDKRAIRQSRAAMEGMMGGSGHPATESGTSAAPPPDVKVEDLGEQTMDGRVVKKLRISSPEGISLGWFDKETGAPVRAEAQVDGKTTSIEWKDYKVGPQPAKLYEVPKGYDLTDMDEMMQKMKGMGGMSGSMKGMMGGMGQSMGANMGGSFGGALGGVLGGPLGSIAGQYLGGKVGGMVGRKAADVVTPGK